MQYNRLGTTDIEVSKICLGTMTWGRQNSENDAFEQMDYAVTRGINFFDTAEMYAVPPNAETYGKTEDYIGNWFARRVKRDDIILASKVAGPSNYFTYIRGGKSHFDQANITAALEDSLKRLKTDYIDLYQLHWPDRAVNTFGQLDYVHKPEADGVPLLETLQALDDCVKAGKIRYVGLSNETPWGAMKCLQLAQQHNLPRMQSIQNSYNLLNRVFDIGLGEIAIRENIGLLAYSPLAGGTLSGKYLNGALPPGSRRALDERPFNRYANPRTESATKAYLELAKLHGLDPSQMALAFVNMQPHLTSNIIGATTMAQLKTDIDSIDITLSPKVLADINRIHWQYPNPAP